nr:hypothetical protein [Tanacetum cinerariifolium]
MQSELWPEIRKGIDQHLGKIYTDNKSSLKRDYWVKNPDDEAYDVERPTNISTEDWDERIRFWFDPKNMARCAQNAQNRAKRTVVWRQGSRTLAALRDRQLESGTSTSFLKSPTIKQLAINWWDEYGFVIHPDAELDSRVPVPNPDLIRYTYCWRRILAGRGSTSIYHGHGLRDRQRGHIPSVGRVLAGRGKDVLDVPVPRCNHTSYVNELKKSNKQLYKQIDMITKAMSSDDSINYLTIPDDMSPEKSVHRVTENRMGPLLSLGKLSGNESPASLTRHIFPGDMYPHEHVVGESWFLSSGRVELRLKREAAERAFEAQAEKDRTLMRLEELRFLATSTKDLDDDDDAYWIKKKKRLIKNKMRNYLGDEDDEDE